MEYLEEDNNNDRANDDTTVSDARGTAKHRVYMHRSRIFHVPLGFVFLAKTKLLGRWRLWMEGKPGFTLNEGSKGEAKAPIFPYQLLKPMMLPSEAKKSYRMNWCPMYKYMEKAPVIDFLGDATAQFEVAYSYL